MAPYWADVSARFVADRSARAQEFLDGGIDRLLASLHPARIRWVPPVLEVLTVSRLRGELRLNGRGLLLVPTVFGATAPTIDLAGEQPCLTYPARHDGHALPLALAERAPDRLGDPGTPHGTTRPNPRGHTLRDHRAPRMQHRRTRLGDPGQLVHRE